MSSGSFRFDRFVLDPRDRRLTCGGVPVEVNARYLDALILLVREHGRLVSKDRFFDEVWRGVPVTDEALTQCIRTLRRQLGDSATRPCFIETVTKHGYRFIAPVEGEDDARAAADGLVVSTGRWRRMLLSGGAGTLGAGTAGLLGGLLYGFAAASQPAPGGASAFSLLLVVVCLTVVIALIGGAGVSFGIAAAQMATRRRLLWSIAGGAVGGIIVGAVVKLLGLDAFGLLFGRSPDGITGAPEGAVLGGVVGLGAWLAGRGPPGRGVAVAAACGGGAGIIITLAGGRLMAGSLVLLSQTFPGSRLRLDQMGSLFGESGFGMLSRIVTGSLEGALFGGCLVGAMMLAGRAWRG